VIERYTLPEMGKVWSPSSRFDYLLEVEKAVALVQSRKRIIPQSANRAIQKRARFDLARIQEIEKTTKHDVIAFVSAVAETVGPEGRYIHFGLTSSDVLDTAISLQIRDAGSFILQKLTNLERVLKTMVRAHRDTLCAGRTHGMHAEPTTFGFKMAGFLAETKRNRQRFELAIKQASRCKLSGAVGTYASQDPEIERLVAKELDLVPEVIATQVVPRDRHAEVITALAFIGAGLERLSVELRHLQRTEVGEVEEAFDPGQKGSSAMPHKKNPIGSENTTGVARLLRGYQVAAMENIALWHERDISHSSVERVIFPDAFIITDYALERMTGIIRNLHVNKERMLQNLDLSQGQTFSSQVLLALIDAGLTRESAYAIVQRHAHGLKPGQQLKDSLQRDPEVKRLLSRQELSNIFSGKKHKTYIPEIIRRVQ